MRSILVVAAYLTLAVTSTAVPAATAPRFDIAPGAGVVWLDPALGLESASAAQLGLRGAVSASEGAALELAVGWARATARPAGRPRHADLLAATLGLCVSLQPRARLQPFFSLAAGWAEDTSTDAPGALGGPLGEIGVGLAWQASPRLGLRVEAREARVTQTSGVPRDLVRTTWLGARLVLGPASWRPGDRDRRTEDRAAPPPLVATDADRDGTPDGQDVCAGTPAGARVDGRGCPADTDADGVLDGLDACPETPAGSHVDARGCGVSALERQLLSPGRVRLDCDCTAGVATLDPSAAADLDALGRLLLRTPRLRVEIAVHTDARGGAERNRALSQRCARAVADRLRSRFPQLGRGQLEARGYGEERPVASNDSELGRARNRRLEIVRLESADAAVAP